MKKNRLTGVTVLAAALMLVLFGACDLLNGKEEEKATIPATPIGVTAAEVPGEGIQINWPLVKNVTNYIIYRGSSAGTGTPNQLIATVSGSESSYLDISGTAGLSYSYAVIARNGEGDSDKSIKTTGCVFPLLREVVPEVPFTPEIIAQGPTSITIKWLAVFGVTEYKLYRSGGLGPITIPVSALSYEDSTVTPDVEYTYEVSALNGTKESGKSSASLAAKAGASGGDVTIDWNNQATNYVFRVRNQTDQELILFKSTLNKTNIIGGVHAHENMHGFAKSALFTVSGDFPIIVLTKAQYDANKNNLSGLANTPFTRIYGYYNSTGSNETVFDINEGLGGEFSLVVQPTIRYNVELRLNGPHGATLGYVEKGQYNTTFKLNAGMYDICPVIRQWNPMRNEIITFYPKYTDGRPNMVNVGLDVDAPDRTINLQTELGTFPLSTGSAFILVVNNADGAVQLLNGTPMVTSTGSNFINYGTERLFQIDMTKLPNGEYAPTRTIGTLQVGTSSIAEDVGDVTLSVDKVYKVTVTGNNANGYTLSSLEEFGNMDLSDFDTN